MLCSLPGQDLFVMAPELGVEIVAHFSLSGIPALGAEWWQASSSSLGFSCLASANLAVLLYTLKMS